MFAEQRAVIRMIAVLALSKVVINQCNKYQPPYCFGFIKKNETLQMMFFMLFSLIGAIYTYTYICVHVHVNMELEIMRSAYE